MVGIMAVALMLVGNPSQIGNTNASEPQQAIVQGEVVQMVGSEVNEVNEPIREVPQVGYITINDVVDAWSIKPIYEEVEEMKQVDTEELIY
jgi:hypothetical protein